MRLQCYYECIFNIKYNEIYKECLYTRKICWRRKDKTHQANEWKTQDPLSPYSISRDLRFLPFKFRGLINTSTEGRMMIATSMQKKAVSKHITIK